MRLLLSDPQARLRDAWARTSFGNGRQKKRATAMAGPFIVVKVINLQRGTADAAVLGGKPPCASTECDMVVFCAGHNVCRCMTDMRRVHGDRRFNLNSSIDLRFSRSCRWLRQTHKYYYCLTNETNGLPAEIPRAGARKPSVFRPLVNARNSSCAPWRR